MCTTVTCPHSHPNPFASPHSPTPPHGPQYFSVLPSTFSADVPVLALSVSYVSSARQSVRHTPTQRKGKQQRPCYYSDRSICALTRRGNKFKEQRRSKEGRQPNTHSPSAGKRSCQRNHAVKLLVPFHGYLCSGVISLLDNPNG